MGRGGNLTLSCSVTVSCWFHGVAMATPVCDRWPSRAKELCVVSHAYRLNGKFRACDAPASRPAQPRIIT